MSESRRRRLHDEHHMAALMRDPRIGPAVRAALLVGAKVGEGRSKRIAFLMGMLLGAILGALVAIALVRLGATEGRQ